MFSFTLYLDIFKSILWDLPPSCLFSSKNYITRYTPPFTHLHQYLLPPITTIAHGRPIAKKGRWSNDLIKPLYPLLFPFISFLKWPKSWTTSHITTTRRPLLCFLQHPVAINRFIIIIQWLHYLEEKFLHSGSATCDLLKELRRVLWGGGGFLWQFAFPTPVLLQRLLLTLPLTEDEDV